MDHSLHLALGSDSLGFTTKDESDKALNLDLLCWMFNSLCMHAIVPTPCLHFWT